MYSDTTGKSRLFINNKEYTSIGGSPIPSATTYIKGSNLDCSVRELKIWSGNLNQMFLRQSKFHKYVGEYYPQMLYYFRMTYNYA